MEAKEVFDELKTILVSRLKFDPRRAAEVAETTPLPKGVEGSIGLDSLDFRVYKVKDPVKFFRQLDNPHQVGEDEEAEVGKAVEKKPDFLERLRQWKSWGYGLVKKYVREQLQNQSRKGFNQKFRPEEDDTSFRTPLDQSSFAQVPLLNPSQMIDSWHEKLPPLGSSRQAVEPCVKRCVRNGGWQRRRLSRRAGAIT